MQPGKIPFLRLLVPLCSGIIISDIYTGDSSPGIICIALSIITAIITLFKLTIEKDIAFGIAVILFLTGAGYIIHYTEEEENSDLENSEQLFLVRLSDFPEKKKNSYTFECSIESSGFNQLSWHPHGKLHIYYVTDTIEEIWTPGDQLIIRMTPIRIKNNGNPCEFNYSRYMKGRGIMYYGFIRPTDIVSHICPERRSIREQSSIAARAMVESFARAGLQGEDLGLVTALTIGDKDLLEKDQLTSFSRAGVMHVMAVSGMHVGMISIFLSSLLFFMKRRLKIIKTIIIITALWAFAFITGLSPSVMRATITFSFLQAGSLMGKQGNSMNILLASAFILLVARPSMLFEAGFQLSYIAVIFIITFYEPFHSLIKIKSRIIDYLWQMVALSIVAQAGTFPLTVRLFNTFPVMFLLSNIVIIPLSFLITILALILFPLSNITFVASAIAWILSKLSYITFEFTSYISSLPGSVITGVGISTAGSIILTLALAMLLTSLLKVAQLTLRSFFILMTFYFATGWIKVFTESRKEGIIVYNIRGEPVPAFQSGRQLSVITHSDEVPSEVARHASTRGLHLSHIKADGNAVSVKNNSHTIELISSGNPACFDTNGAEMIIASGKIDFTAKCSFSDISPPILVASSAKRKNIPASIKTYFISDSGALVLIRKKGEIWRP